MPPDSPPEPVPNTAPAATRRDRKPPRWIILALLGLFACWFIAMQWRQRSGEPIRWERDFAQAERLARESDRLVFLMLQTPDSPVTAAIDRDLFSQREVRERMAKFVCCRLDVQASDPIARRFGFHHDPLAVVVEPGSQRPLLPPIEGKFQYQEFDTLTRETLRHAQKSQTKEP